MQQLVREAERRRTLGAFSDLNDVGCDAVRRYSLGEGRVDSPERTVFPARRRRSVAVVRSVAMALVQQSQVCWDADRIEKLELKLARRLVKRVINPDRKGKGHAVEKVPGTLEQIEQLKTNLGWNGEEWNAQTQRLMRAKESMLNPIRLSTYAEAIEAGNQLIRECAGIRHSIVVGRRDTLDVVELNPDGDKGTVVWNNMNAETWRRQQGTLRALVESGYRVVAYDYRGVCKSTGKARSPATLVEDAVAVAKFAMQGREHGQSVIMAGQSLGGGVATLATARLVKEGITNVSLWNIHSFGLLSECGAQMVSRESKFSERMVRRLMKLGRVEMNVIAAVRKLLTAGIRVKVAHSRFDQMIQYNVGQCKTQPQLHQMLEGATLTAQQQDYLWHLEMQANHTDQLTAADIAALEAGGEKYGQAVMDESTDEDDVH